MSKGRDRISNLPDSLLYHIISFLNIKDGARTSVLSHRWNSIWTTVPTLHFRQPWECDSFTLPTSSETDRFMDFVDGTLHRHNWSNIENFLLFWRAHLNGVRVHSWISTVVRGKVKQLILHLYQNQCLIVPLSLFTCESLTSLELRAYPNFTFPKYISIPRLKRLKLYEFKFSDECWSEELFSNSSILEELILESCIFRMSNFCVSIPTLKLLKIHSWDFGVDGLRDCALKICTPSLSTFTYSADVAKEFALSTFLTLVEAVVCLKSEKDGAEICRLFQATVHVKCLTVGDLTLKAICSAYDVLKNLPTFHNVKMLKVSDILTTDEGLIALLKAVPNLESLVFDWWFTDEEEEDSVESDEDDSEDDGDDDSEDEDANSVESANSHNPEDEKDVSDVAECDNNEDDGNEDSEDEDANSVESANIHNPEDVEDVSDAAECDNNDKGKNNCDNKDDCWMLDIVATGCLCAHLKSVCFQSFAGNPREIKWVKLILRNAKALQMMTIRYCSDCDCRFVTARSEEELMIEIPSFPRASSGCVFNFCSSD